MKIESKEYILTIAVVFQIRIKLIYSDIAALIFCLNSLTSNRTIGIFYLFPITVMHIYIKVIPASCLHITEGHTLRQRYK